MNDCLTIITNYLKKHEFFLLRINYQLSYNYDDITINRYYKHTNINNIIEFVKKKCLDNKYIIDGENYHIVEIDLNKITISPNNIVLDKEEDNENNGYCKRLIGRWGYIYYESIKKCFVIGDSFDQNNLIIKLIGNNGWKIKKVSDLF